MNVFARAAVDAGLHKLLMHVLISSNVNHLFSKGYSVIRSPICNRTLQKEPNLSVFSWMHRLVAMIYHSIVSKIKICITVHTLVTAIPTITGESPVCPGRQVGCNSYIHPISAHHIPVYAGISSTFMKNPLTVVMGMEH